jgi:hypothetical protein
MLTALRARMQMFNFSIFISLAVHIEIVEPRLPDRPQRFFHVRKRQLHLADASPLTRRDDVDLFFR